MSIFREYSPQPFAEMSGREVYCQENRPTGRRAGFQAAPFVADLNLGGTPVTQGCVTYDVSLLHPVVAVEPMKPYNPLRHDLLSD